MPISFAKTTWVDLNSPYIDAAQLNRIETVLDALVNGSSRAVWRNGDTMTGALSATALTASTGNVNAAAGGIQTAGVMRISNGGAGTLTTLSTTGLADLASARVQSLTASQMVATDASKNLVSWDAATARTNLGAVSSVDAIVKNPSAEQKITSHALVVERSGTNQAAFAAWIAGDTLGRIALRSDGAVEWGSGAAIRDTNLYRAAADHLKTDGIFGAETIQTAGVTRISSGGAGTLTTLSTTGMVTAAQATVQDLTPGRMVSTTTGGRLQALDAAGSRALLDAAQNSTSRKIVSSYAGYISDTKTSGTTLTTLKSFTYPAGTFNANKVVRFRVVLYVAPNGTDSVSLQIKVGSTYIYERALSTISGQRWVTLDVTLVTPDSTHLNPVVDEKIAIATVYPATGVEYENTSIIGYAPISSSADAQTFDIKAQVINNSDSFVSLVSLEAYYI